MLCAVFVLYYIHVTSVLRAVFVSFDCFVSEVHFLCFVFDYHIEMCAFFVFCLFLCDCLFAR